MTNDLVTRHEYDDHVEYQDSRDRRHRDDGPAVLYENGTKVWYRHGELHRDDGPAVEWFNGAKTWCQHGVYHRVGGPSWVMEDGSLAWYLDGVEYAEQYYWYTVWADYGCGLPAASWLFIHGAHQEFSRYE